MDKRLMLIAAVLIAVALLSVYGPGAFGTAGQIQSVSKTTLDGKVASIITTYAYSGGASLLTMNIDKVNYPNWQSNKTAQLILEKKKDTYSYSLSERSGSSKGVPKYVFTSGCSGQYDCIAKYPGKSFTQFKSDCRATNSNNVAVDTGVALNPIWSCYSETPAWIISDFDRIGGIYAPSVLATVLLYPKGAVPGVSDYEAVAQVELDNTNRAGRLITDAGDDLGSVNMDSLVSTFNTPPAASGIKAIRPAQGGNYILVDGAIDSDVRDVRDTFQLCLHQAQRSSAGITTINFGPFGVEVAESYNPEVSDCFRNLATNVFGLQNIRPTGDFAAVDSALDSSKLSTERKITITNKYTIPVVRYILFGDQVQLITPLAVPVSLSCENKNLQGGVRSSIRATVANGLQGAGPIEWSALCSPPITVLTGAGALDLGVGQTGSFDVPITTGASAGTYPCSITAYSSDRKVSITSTCQVTQTSVCDKVAKVGCYINEACVEVCPSPTLCSDNTVVGECNLAKQRCKLVGGVPTLQSDSTCGGANQTLSCLPIIQRQVTTTSGAAKFELLGITLFSFGGTATQSCETDYVGLLLVIVAALGGLYILKKR